MCLCPVLPKMTTRGIPTRAKRWLKYALTFWLVGLLLPDLVALASEPILSLDKSVSPSTVLAGGRVTYTIRVTNSGDAAAEGLSVRDMLPAGFAYRPGSSQVKINGVTVSTADPSRVGNSLTWSGLRLPAGRSTSYYGMHTFVQRRFNEATIKNQLDWSLELMGPGAFVTQLLDGIENSWVAAPDYVRWYVDWAYDRGLTPVIRLAGTYGGTSWIKPKRDSDGTYYTWAQTVTRMVRDLPKRGGFNLYIQIWNEPNLNEEWEGQANPAEYGQFLVETADAIRALHDPHIKILNAPLSPGGEYWYLTYLEDMLNQVPRAVDAFDVWASHPYPGNRPPSYNVHDNTSRDNNASIDLYQRELEILARHGRRGVNVLLTETGYALNAANDVFYPAIGEANRADYMLRAFRDYWRKWPEVIGVCPYELVDPEASPRWLPWDWRSMSSSPHQQYDTIRALAKSYTPVSSELRITFDTTAGVPGTYANQVTVSASNLSGSISGSFAIVTVVEPTPTRTATPTPSSTATSTTTNTPMPTRTEALSPTWTSTAQPSATLSTMTPVVTEETLTPSQPASVTPTIPPATYTATPTPSPTGTPNVTATPTTPLTECLELVTNGDFESRTAWTGPSESGCFGQYDSTQYHSPSTSMRVGFAPGSQDADCWSSMWQTITIPSDATDLRFSCWYSYRSTDTTEDVGYISIYDGDTGTQLKRILTLHADVSTWMLCQDSLDLAWKGKQVLVRFGVHNDGDGQPSTMYVDDVSVLVCRATPVVTPTPTLTPTPLVTFTPTSTTISTLSPTPVPTLSPTARPSPTPGCADLLENGGFEQDTAWTISQTAYPGGYSTATVHSGQRSMRLGMQGADDIYSFSTAWQEFYVPTNARNVLLSFWYYPQSTDPAHDYQYILILDEHGGILEWVLQVHSDAQGWTRVERSLDAYCGKTIRISLGVYNNGGGAGGTSMYVDDVSVSMCEGQPTATPVPFTPVAWVYLPVLLRQGSAQVSQFVVVTAPASALMDLPAQVTTLWQSQEAAAQPDYMQGVALNLGTGELYVAVDKQVWVLDRRSGDVLAQIELPAAPRGLAVDVTANRIFAGLWDANALAIIDGARHRLIQVVPDIARASGVAIGQGRVYVAATGSNELVVLDSYNGAIIRRVPVGQAPYGVACDEGAQQRVFVTNSGDDSVSIVNTKNGVMLHTVQLGGWGFPQGIAFDSVRDRLYVTYALSPKYGAVAAIDASSGQVLSRLVGNLAQPLFAACGISVDPVRGWVYLTAADGTLVLTAETLDILQELPDVGPAYAFGLALDVAGESVYIVDARLGRLAVCTP